MICPFCENELHAHVYVSGVEVGMYCPDCYMEIPMDMLIGTRTEEEREE